MRGLHQFGPHKRGQNIGNNNSNIPRSYLIFLEESKIGLNCPPIHQLQKVCQLLWQMAAEGCLTDPGIRSAHSVKKPSVTRPRLIASTCEDYGKPFGFLPI